jgi:hypothetical protein
MMAKLKFVAPLLMAGAAVTAIGAAPIAAAESFAVATGASSITVPLQGGSGGPGGGSACDANGTCGSWTNNSGGGCTAAGVCGNGGPWGGGGCVPGVGCFQWGQP